MDRSMLLVMVAATLVIVAGPDSSRAAEVKPIKPDTPAHLQPGEITFSTSIAPERARPGETVTYQVTAKLEGLMCGKWCGPSRPSRPAGIHPSLL